MFFIFSLNFLPFAQVRKHKLVHISLPQAVNKYPPAIACGISASGIVLILQAASGCAVYWPVSRALVTQTRSSGTKTKPPSEREGDRIAVEGACESSPRLTLTATERSCTHSPSVAYGASSLRREPFNLIHRSLGIDLTRVIESFAVIDAVRLGLRLEAKRTVLDGGNAAVEEMLGRHLL